MINSSESAASAPRFPARIWDSTLWRFAEGWFLRYRIIKAHFRQRRSLVTRWAALDERSPSYRRNKLRVLLHGGAYDMAAALACELLDQPAARSDVVAALQAVGDNDRVEALGGSSGRQSATAGFAQRRWWAPLSNPEIYLAMANASSDRASALVAFNRYLRSQGLPRCNATSSLEGQNFLASLRFEVGRTVHSGPLVSVVVAACNAAQSLGFSIDSLLNQTYQKLEILVCDDASDDATLSLLEERYGRDPRVRLFRSTRRQGPYNIRNALLERAQGELVTFHDADDLSLPTRIALQVDRMRNKIASLVAELRMKESGEVTFFHRGQAARPAMVSLMVARHRLPPFRSAWFGADLEMRESLRARFPARAIDVVVQTHIVALDINTSLTRRPGSESLRNGYRSPARRAYSEMVFRRYVIGDVDDADIERVLRETNNYAEPAAIEPVGGDAAANATGSITEKR